MRHSTEVLRLLAMFLLSASSAVKSSALLLRGSSGRQIPLMRRFGKRTSTFEPSLLDTVQRTIQDEIMKESTTTDPDPVTMILGVSGGCDSVALLHMLQSMRKEHWELRVVHFDHQQRGSKSDDDRLFTEKLCSQYNLPFDCYYWDECNQQPSLSSFSQDAARQWRRSCMMRLRDKQRNRTLLLTAHHKDDSEETLLLKLLRGVHLTNLSGLLPLSEDGIWGRPLIHVRKHDIIDYLKENDWDWREDDSNKSSKYLRNRVRNELVPLLQDMVGQQGLARRLQNMQDQATDIRRDLSRRVDLTLKNQDSDVFLLPRNESDRYLALEAFRTWAAGRGCIIDYDQMKRIRVQAERQNQTQWTLNVGKLWDVECYGKSLRLRKVSEEEDSSVATEPEPSSCELECFKGESSSIEENIDGFLVIHVAHEVHEEKLRFTRSVVGLSNFTMTPPWRRNPIKVTEILRGQKVPLHRRPEAPIVIVHYSSGEQDVVAVYAETNQRWICDARYAKPEKSTRAAIRLQVGNAVSQMKSGNAA